MGAREVPSGRTSGKVSGRKVDADVLKNDVKEFASQLGLVTGVVGSDAFSDFAPSKAKQKIAPGSSKTLQRHPPGVPAAVGPEAATNASNTGDSKSREWNFGVGPRPGEAKGFRSLLGKSESGVWYRTSDSLSSAIAAALPAGVGVAAGEVDPDLFEHRQAAAEALIEAEAATFEKELQRRNPADAKWLQQVRRAGTSTDKLAAATLLVQESVVANMAALDQLVSLATKRGGGKELVRQAMEGLQELFTNVLLPDRKLKFLEQQPLKDLPVGRDGEKLLLLWWTEDCVKRRYAEFVGALEEHSKDNLEFLKEKSMRVMAEMLTSKPECEARLLSALVNKLGDPSRQVASKAVYLLMQILGTHPVMKPVVVREVERFVFRPGLTDKARYYAVIFLNQLPLSHRASEGGDVLAKQLISIYFTLFRMVVEGHIGAAAQLRKQQEEKYAKEKVKFWREQQQAANEGRGQYGRGGRGRSGRGGRAGGRGAKPTRPPPPPKLALSEEVDARLLSGLITGVRRAFPYVKSEDVEPLVEQSASQLFRLVHTAPFTVAVQSLMLMYQLMSARAAISDRYYRALYAALDRDGPTTSSRAPMFLALLFKAMQGDVSVKRVAAFAKRLLQLAAAAQPNWACGALMLISQVLASQPALWAAITHPEDVAGSGVEEFKDTGDPDDELLADAAADDVEPFRDDVEEDHEIELAGINLDLNGARRLTHALASTSSRCVAGAVPSGCLAAKAAAAQAAAAAAELSWPKPGYYEIDKREPLYANADRSCWWELTALAAHAHPSVAAMARSLLAGAPVVFDGDPLRDLSLIAFLDKFVNKKPKPVDRSRSVMQPTAVPLGGTLDTVALSTAAGKRQPPRPASLAQLSSDAFAALAEAQVESADLFFHKFLNLKGVKDKRAARKKQTDDKEASDDGSLSDAEVDRYLEKQEGMVDDAQGDPDMGYDYDNLAAAMEEDGLDDDGEGDDASDSEDDEGGTALDRDDDGGSLEDINILELPSPSAEDEVEDESDEEQVAVRRKRHREEMEKAGITEADLQALSSDDDDEEEASGSDAGEDKEEEDEEGGEDSDSDDELLRFRTAGSDDDNELVDDMDYLDVDGSDEDDGAKAPEPALVGGGGRGKVSKEADKKGKKGDRGEVGGGLFASAEDYEALIDRAEREELEGAEGPGTTVRRAEGGGQQRSRGRGGGKGRDGRRGAVAAGPGRGRGGRGGRGGGRRTPNKD